MTKFLLIDDHYVVRSGTRGLLFEYFKPCQVDEASDGASAIEKIKSSQYDLILMDVQMPNTETFGLMEYFHIRYPDSKVLMFSMSPENIYAKRFLKAGAMGFLSKESPPEEIQKAIMLVLSGRKYISNSLAVILAEESFSEKPANVFNKLSTREFEIACLLLSGQTVSGISRSLNLQTSTVGTHKARVFEKLGITNVLELKELAAVYNL